MENIPIPFYVYKHPETGETFEELRSISDRDKPYISEDGTECPRDINSEICSGWKGDKEIWEACPDEVKAYKPKYLRLKDGSRVKYDPTKHR